jgi:hypothetical protein
MRNGASWEKKEKECTDEEVEDHGCREQSCHNLWNDRMGQIGISMLGKLARHWGSQKTVSIISVIAGSV